MKIVWHPIWWLWSWGAATLVAGAMIAAWDTVSFWIVTFVFIWWELSAVGFIGCFWDLDAPPDEPGPLWKRSRRKGK